MLRGERRMSLALLLVFACAYAAVARLVFHAFPYSGDEYAQVLQAEIFAKGELSAPAPEHAELFSVDHVIIDQKVRCKYPPGGPALLSIGTIAGTPWLVAPLEATLALMFLRRAALLSFGDRAALVTVVVAGVSPLFVFNAATFFSQTPATMWLSLSLSALASFYGDGRRRWLLLAGTAVGCAFVTRPFDALVFATPLLLLGSRRVVGWIAVSGFPALLLLLAYQKAQFGAPLIDGYRVYEPEYRALYGEASRSALSIKYLIDPEQIWHHLDALRGLLLDWTLPGSILLFALGAVVLPRNESASSRMRDLTVGLLGACVLGFLPTLSIPDDGPPTRYLSPALLPIALLSGPGWIAFRELLDARIGALGSLGVGSVAIGLSVASFASVLDKRLPLLWEREGLSREVAARGLRHAVVLVHAQFPTRYTRNGTTFDNSVLYVRPDVATPQTLALWFPGRSVHEAVEGRMWTLLPVQGP